jgi:hypothetical protein
MKKIATLFMVVLMASLSLSAEIYVKTKTHTDPVSFMGQNQPAKDEIQEQWLADDKMAMVGKDQSFVVDLKKNIMLMINHSSKTYVETTLPLDLAKLLPPEAAAMAGMLNVSATVTPLNEKKKVGSWNCQGYTMNMSVMGMAMPMKIWATTEVPFDASKFQGMMAQMLKGQMRLDDNSVKEMMKIKGFQVASEMNAEIMGMKIGSKSEALEISQKTAPAGIFSAPAGYAKRDKLNMEELTKR